MQQVGADKCSFYLHCFHKFCFGILTVSLVFSGRDVLNLSRASLSAFVFSLLVLSVIAVETACVSSGEPKSWARGHDVRWKSRSRRYGKSVVGRWRLMSNRVWVQCANSNESIFSHVIGYFELLDLD